MLIAGREVQITNPDRVFFPVAGYTKGDLLDCYLAVAEGAVRAIANRPMALKRFVQGAEGEALLPKASAREPPASGAARGRLRPLGRPPRPPLREHVRGVRSRYALREGNRLGPRLGRDRREGEVSTEILTSGSIVG